MLSLSRWVSLRPDEYRISQKTELPRSWPSIGICPHRCLCRRYRQNSIRTRSTTVLLSGPPTHTRQLAAFAQSGGIVTTAPYTTPLSCPELELERRFEPTLGSSKCSTVPHTTVVV